MDKRFTVEDFQRLYIFCNRYDYMIRDAIEEALIEVNKYLDGLDKLPKDDVAECNAYFDRGYRLGINDTMHILSKMDTSYKIVENTVGDNK